MPSLLNTVKDLERLRQIVGVLTRHGFGEFVNRTGLGSLRRGDAPNTSQLSLGQRVRHVLQDLGPSFIKLGQIVSTRPDVIPAEVITELKKLQDDVPAEPFEEIRAVIESELGGPLDEIFESVDETPLASASIGQVHRAQLKSDDGPIEVVVKVQRPQVRNVVERDVDLLYWLAHLVERTIPEAELYNPVRMVGEFDRGISAELDFVLEADHCEQFAQNFQGKRFVKFPGVHRHASSRRVLTLEYLEGKKIYDAIADGTRGEDIARRSVDIIVKQIFEDGFFHADPHPGNIFIQGDPERPVVAMIDLGMVGRLTPQMRDRVIDLMVAAVREDFRGVADALYAIGRPTRKVDRRAYEAEVARVSQKYLGKKLGDIQGSALIKDLVDGARKFGIEIPPDFLLLGKAMMTVEGVGKEIYPELDLFEEVKPYFLKLIRQRYSPEKLTQDVLRGVMRMSTAASEMPMQMQEILEDLRQGAFNVQVHERRLPDTADRLGRRFFSGMVVSALLISGAILVATENFWLGGITFATGVIYGSMHATVMFWSGTRKPRP